MYEFWMGVYLVADQFEAPKLLPHLPQLLNEEQSGHDIAASDPSRRWPAQSHLSAADNHTRD